VKCINIKSITGATKQESKFKWIFCIWIHPRVYPACNSVKIIKFNNARAILHANSFFRYCPPSILSISTAIFIVNISFVDIGVTASVVVIVSIGIIVAAFVSVGIGVAIAVVIISIDIAAAVIIVGIGFVDVVSIVAAAAVVAAASVVAAIAVVRAGGLAPHAIRRTCCAAES